MNTINILLNHSFNHHNDELYHVNFDNYVYMLDKVIEYCFSKKMIVFYDLDIYNEEIIPNTYLGNWLYETSDNGENEIEKSILREIFDKKCTNDLTTSISGISAFEICFYNIFKERESFILGLKKWLDYRRILLTKVTDRNNFESELNICFPELVFSEEIHTSLNGLKRFREWGKHIVSHLSILNDYGQALFIKHGEVEAIKAIESMLPNGAKCTGQNSNNREKLSFRVKTIHGENILVDCFPHTKLISANSDGRIYFRFRHSQIADNNKIIIGWIGTHLDD